MMRGVRFWWFLLLLLIGGSSYFFLFASAKTSPSPTTKPDKPISVSTQVATRQTVTLWIDALGSVNPQHQITIKSRIDGQLLSTHFKEGDWVDKGQRLALIDPKPLESQLAQLEAQKQRNLALLNNAQRDLKRYQQLTQEDAISAQQTDTQGALVKQHQATLAADEASINQLKLQLSYTQISAPIGGKVGFRLIDPGNQIKANDATGITTITQLDPIHVVFSIPEQHLTTLHQSLKKGPLRIEVWDKERKTLLASSREVTLNNQIDADTGSLKMKALFDNPDQRLYPNQFVTVRVERETIVDALTIPQHALLVGPQGDYVFAVSPEKKVQAIKVNVIDRADDRWVISPVEFVDDGTPLVVEGTDKLKNQSLVKIVESQPKPNTTLSP